MSPQALVLAGMSSVGAGGSDDEGAGKGVVV